jgi:predicted nucleic acid-binding protein
MKISETFIDTSGFYAFLAKHDDMHEKACDVLHAAAESITCFVTTDYVLDETATLLAMRGHKHVIPEFFNTIFRSNACRVEWMDQDRFFKTLNFFKKHSDHSYSFTDCFSFQVMRQLRIKHALTKDRHFKEAGYEPVLL